MLPVSSDPSQPARFRQPTTLTRSDGSTLRVGPSTPCTARPADAANVWVETFAPEPTSLWRRLRGDVPMRRTARGLVPAADVIVRERGAYVSFTTPIFSHPPRLEDLVQKGHGRISAFAACVLAIVQQEPDRITQLFVDHADGTVTVRLHPQAVRIHKSLPRKPKDGAVWWRLLQKAIVVQGWPSDGSHTATCPGGDCATFIRLLTGHRPQTHALHWHDPEYVCAMVDEAFAAADKLGLAIPRSLRREPVALVEQYLARTMTIKLSNVGVVCMTTRATLPATTLGVSPAHSYAVLWVREHHGSYDVQLRDPRTGHDLWLSLHSFLHAAAVLCFAELRTFGSRSARP